MATNPREVNMKLGIPDRITMLVQGPSGAGKTHYLGTWPKIRVLSAAIEDGHQTLIAMAAQHPERLYDRNWIPQVRRISTMKDLYEEFTLANEDFEKGLIKTLAIDSLTWVAQMILNTVRRDMYAEQKTEPDNRQVYGKLQDTMRNVLDKAHNLGHGRMNIIWTAIDGDPDDSGKQTPLIAGATRKMAPTACSCFFYLNVYEKEDKLRHELRTRPFGIYFARHRYGDLIPDPLKPTYRALAECLGMEKPRAAKAH
jgi:hypothetical protein